MTVTSIQKDPEALTLVVTAEFDAGVDPVWQLWEDPRLLERWWGPPTYPASVQSHDLVPGGRVTYSMTGPEGDTHHGWWRVIAVDRPKRIEFADGFADATGTPNPDLPTTTSVVTFEEHEPGRTRMEIETTFPSLDAMEQMVQMGMEEGLREAMGQMDDVLRSISG